MILDYPDWTYRQVSLEDRDKKIKEKEIIYQKQKLECFGAISKGAQVAFRT